MNNFQSEYAKTADDLVRLKSDAYRPVSDRRERLDVIRRFTNMMPTLTDEEAEELGVTEVTNHGLSYRAMVQNQTQYQSMVTVTNALVEVLVDTDNPEQDFVVGQRISEAINRGAIHHKGKFARFWDKVAGEFVIAGGCPVTWPEKYGWLPSPQLDMFFPPETGLDPEDVPYSFIVRQLTVDDIEKLLQTSDDEEGTYIDKASLKELLKKIRSNIKEGSVSSTAYGEEVTRGTREDNHKEVNIPAWEFYEMKYDKKGEQYVSSTLFVDASHYVSKKAKGANCYILAYYDKAFSYACDWLQLPYVDSEIGGVKNLDTIKGVAEMQYPSAIDMEELLNLIIEGEKLRARPMFKVADQANVDKLAKWDARKSLYAPEGVEEMVLRGNSNGLQGPLAILSQNASGITQTGTQGNSGNLRVEALANQQETAMLQTNKVSDAYNHLDSILEGVVFRLLTAEEKPGTEGYREIMWVRNYLKKYNIDFKKLAKRKYGRFEFLRVRAKRSVGNGDRQQQLETSQWLMDNIQAYAPAARPIVIHQATTLRTQDPDLADRLVKIPQAIINAQKITAENEADTIRRRASLGQILPIAEDDVHQDHIPIHMLDMQALLSRHALRPWDKLDLLEFAGLTEHTMEHITVLYENPETNGEAKGYLQDFQNIAQAAQKIVAEVQQREGAEENQLTPKEQADLQIKMAELNLKAQALGLKEAEIQGLWRERESKNMLNRRSQYVKEINEDERLKIDRERAAAEVQRKKQDGKETKK